VALEREYRNIFRKLFGSDQLALFAPDEVDVLVSGEEVLDWDASDENASYTEG
jgi:hypothetical protein